MSEAESASPEKARLVLLVEDEELVALDLVESLNRRGWQIVGPAATLEEAMSLVATGVPLDAAVLDVNLRGRWVHTLAEELARRGVPFVVCTGYELVDPDNKFADAPIIAKPIVGDRVGAALSDLLSSPQTPAPEASPKAS